MPSDYLWSRIRQAVNEPSNHPTDVWRRGVGRYSSGTMIHVLTLYQDQQGSCLVDECQDAFSSCCLCLDCEDDTEALSEVSEPSMDTS